MACIQRSAQEIGARLQIKKPMQMVPIPTLKNLAIAQNTACTLYTPHLTQAPFVVAIRARLLEHSRMENTGKLVVLRNHVTADAANAHAMRTSHLDIDERRIVCPHLEERQVRVE
jgi:hypothetical protein